MTEAPEAIRKRAEQSIFWLERGIELCSHLQQLTAEERGTAATCRDIVRAPTVSYETITTFGFDGLYLGQMVVAIVCAIIVFVFVAFSRTSEYVWYDFIELSLFPALVGWSSDVLNATAFDPSDPSVPWMATQDLLLGEFVPLTPIELSAVHVVPMDPSDCPPSTISSANLVATVQPSCYGSYTYDRADASPLLRESFELADNAKTCDDHFSSGRIAWYYGCDRHIVL